MLVIVHDQYATPAQVGLWKLPAYTCLAPCEFRGKPEGGAHAQLAFQPHFAAHQFGKLLGNRQTKPRSPILARGRGVGLLEALE